jgi:hypothetical protein
VGDGTGTWEPGGSALPSSGDLREAASLWREHGEGVGASLVEPLRTCLRGAMQAPAGALDEAVAELDEADLGDLVRLFTIVEVLPGFEAGARSPVIALARRLKTRMDAEAYRDVVRWVRAHTDNRFLPHGSLQDRLRA